MPRSRRYNEWALLTVDRLVARAGGDYRHPPPGQRRAAAAEWGSQLLRDRRSSFPRKKSIAKLKEAIRAKTRRTNGKSIKTLSQELNGILKGWFECFKHSKSDVFESIDGYTRGRPRSILRKRHGGKGRGRGCDHRR